MWLTSFRKAFLEATLDALWRHWTTLGVFGQSESFENRPVDPEALIIPTAAFGRFDPRLFDAFLEWWARNDQWLSSTRLKRLARILTTEERRILSAVVESILLQKRPKKWDSLVKRVSEAPEAASANPLFFMIDGAPLPTVGSTDLVFRRFGFLRPKIEMRGIAEEVPLGRIGNLRLKLRGLFGLTSRAEIILYLLTHRRAHPRLIARHVHYAYDSVAKALRQMALAGVLSRQRREKEIQYELNRRAWTDLLDVPANIAWVDWAAVFSALRHIWLCTDELREKPTTDSILGAELHQCAMFANRFLADGEIEFTFSSWSRRGFERYLEPFEEEIGELFRKLQVKFPAVAAMRE